MSGHTPVPWRAFILDKPAADIPDYVAKCVAAGPGADFFFVLATDERGECDVAHVGNGPRAEANARLIAAAPDLLRIAELLVDWLDEEESAHKLCDAARSAIAKATQGSPA